MVILVDGKEKGWLISEDSMHLWLLIFSVEVLRHLILNMGRFFLLLARNNDDQLPVMRSSSLL